MLFRHGQRWGHLLYSKLKFRDWIWVKIWFLHLKLLTRGYKKSEVLNCLADISYKRRNIYLQDVPKIKNEIPLVFCTHHFPQRSNAQIKKALIKNWHYISENKKLSKIVPCPPILALRRTQNLGERLIRAKITQTQNSHTSLTPKMQNTDDASSQIGSCSMSPTLKDLLDLLDETIISWHASYWTHRHQLKLFNLFEYMDLTYEIRNTLYIAMLGLYS